MIESPDRVFIARGGCAELFACTHGEVLICGPAGTGKTFGVLQKLHYCLQMNPGIRALAVRKTRASMTESVLVTYENEILPPGHPAKSGPTREHRHSYKYPNGSELVCGGMDNPDRIMSTQYDLIAAFEATELVLDDWEKLITRNRNGVLKYQQAIADCNPSTPYHWLNQRADDVRMIRLHSRLEDNPRWFDTAKQEWTEQGAAYRVRLSNLSGPRYIRLVLGHWTAAEGLIFDNYDPATHIIRAVPLDENGKSVIRWHFAAVDWGHAAPGVIGVIGVDGDGRAYVVHQTYRTGQDIDWWADEAYRLDKLYDLQRFVCDPSAPGNISMFNRRLDSKGGVPLATEADNEWMAGIDAARQRFDKDSSGRPRLFILADSLKHRDERRDERKLPCGLAEELPGYVYMKDKDTDKPIDKEARNSEAHAIDAICRYGMMYLENHDHTPSTAPGTYAPFTYGELLKHDEVMEWVEARTA